MNEILTVETNNVRTQSALRAQAAGLTVRPTQPHASAVSAATRVEPASCYLETWIVMLEVERRNVARVNDKKRVRAVKA